MVNSNFGKRKSYEELIKPISRIIKSFELYNKEMNNTSASDIGRRELQAIQVT